MEVREKLYIKIANSAISQFESSDTPLASTTVKEARSEGFNEKQVRRLVERVNTMAHLHSMDKMSSASKPDRFVDFDIVDPTKVLKALGRGSKTTKTANSKQAASFKTGGVSRYETFDKYASSTSGTSSNLASYTYDPVFGENARPLPNERERLVLEKLVLEKHAGAEFGTKLASYTETSPAQEEERQCREVVERSAALDMRDKLSCLHAELETRAKIASARYTDLVVSLGKDLERCSQSEVDRVFLDYQASDPKEASILGSSLADSYSPYNYKIPYEASQTKMAQHVVLRRSPLTTKFASIKAARSEALDYLRGFARLNNFLT